jgi:hypothetical protein
MSVSDPGTPHEMQEREEPPELVDSSAAAHIRRIRHELVADLFMRRGLFWKLVRELRERKNITPSVAIPQRQTTFETLLYPEGEPQFPGLAEQPPDDQEEADRWREQHEELEAAFRKSWEQDLNSIITEVVPERYYDASLGRSLELNSWQGFVSACVLHDPPATSLLEFAQYSSPPYYRVLGEGGVTSGRGKYVHMTVPPIRVLRDPFVAERIEAWFWRRVLGEVERRYLEPQGIKIQLARILEECPEIWEERREATHANERRSYILVDEHTTEADVRKAFRTIAAQQDRSPTSKPKRDPLLALQCAVLYDRLNRKNPDDGRQWEWTYEKLAEELGLESWRAARDYVRRGRELLEDK